MKSKPYHLNEQQTIARFYPPKASWQKKLTAIEYFSSSNFVSGGLCFNGELNLERFLDAMHHCLQDFDFLFFQLHRAEGDLYASYSTEGDNKPFVQLEIEKKQELINATTLAAILPTEVDERIKAIVTDQFDDLPMGAFKLTTYLDGFAIGHYLNHAFFDQSSVVYFYKYLSQLYSYGKAGISLKKPNLVDIDYLSLSVKPPQVFENLIDFREHSEALMGFKYSSPSSDHAAPSSTAEPSHSPDLEPSSQHAPYLTVDLNFDISAINKLKNTVEQYLSVNDIIHAILLKIYSFYPDLPLDKYFNFGFACNMRKYCGLGEDAIGNVLTLPLMLLKLADIKNKTILELALSNRERVTEINLDFFKESLVWYRYFQAYQENALHYMASFDLLNAKATNWSTFDYAGIQFDGIAPIELKAPNLAPFRVNVISFANKEGEQILKSSIDIPLHSLNYLLELEHDTKLFTSQYQMPIAASEHVAITANAVGQSEALNKLTANKLTAYKGIVFSPKSSPIAIINGTSLSGEKIQFQRHEIAGDLAGECGIIAIPIMDKRQLYNDILEVLKNDEHPFHAEILKLLGDDIMHLIALPHPNINLERNMQEPLIQLALQYQAEASEANRLRLQQACCQVPICLAYLQDDLMARNWLSINVLCAWAFLSQVNLRIWQVQITQQATVLAESIANSSLPVHEILYVNGNHFDILQRVEEQHINELTSSCSK